MAIFHRFLSSHGATGFTEMLARGSDRPTHAGVQLRRILADNKLLREKIERLEKKYDEQFQQVFAILECMIQEDDGPTTGFITGFVARSSEKVVVKARGRKGSEAC